jgi:YidC/Oxa1 family membrane protein insertase
MEQNRNIFFVILLFLLIWVTWYQIKARIWPTTPETPSTAVGENAPGPRKEEDRAAPVRLPALSPPTPQTDRPILGNDDPLFELRVELDPLGGGIRNITLPKFQAASDNGQPVWQTDADGHELRDANGKRIPEPLQLVKSPYESSSYLLLAFDPNKQESSNKSPEDTLGRVRWNVVKKGDSTIERDTIQVDGQDRKRERVAFQTEVDGVRITKTFSLVEGQYHVGMDVTMERIGSGPLPFRYQLTGARGLPVEGKWYTTTYRNALLATEDKNGNIYRDFQDLRNIDLWGGGNSVVKSEGRFIRYAGVSVQYFASVISIDPRDSQNLAFLALARPTLERATLRGTIRNITPPRQGGDKGGWTVLSAQTITVLGDDKTEVSFQVRPEDLGRFSGLQPNERVAVIYEVAPQDGGKFPRVALDIKRGQEALATHALWENDITIRMNTEPIDLKPGVPVTHSYLLYNGPVKVSQLHYLQRDRAVDPSVVNHYLNDLHLNTLSDYHMQGWFGEFLNAIYWSSLVIHCTNLMHWILGMLHSVIPSYGLCIILLTVLVRGLMFPLSRKQAIMSIKMQQLAPEMKKIGEQHKDDPVARQQAQMELWKKHNVNPLGGCWFMLLQMPIMIGLYCALQESILFRLGSFWPTWITNLAAPDMLLYWTWSIPWISRHEDFGSSPLFLGPYLNILPIIAVTLMLIQQKMYTPPPTDEQQEINQKMMGWMMAFMGFMFYKMPAGLCVYFIASSLWGFAERRLLPRHNKSGATPDSAAGTLALATPTASSTAVTTASAQSTSFSNGGGKGKKGKRKGNRGTSVDNSRTPEPATGVRSWFKERSEKISNWWNDILEQARKK